MAIKEGKLLILIGAIVALLSLYIIRTLEEGFLGLLVLALAGYFIQSGQNQLMNSKAKKTEFLIKEIVIIIVVLFIIYLISSYFNLYLAIGLLIAFAFAYFFILNKK